MDLGETIRDSVDTYFDTVLMFLIMESDPTIRNASGTLDKAFGLLMVVARAREPMGLNDLADQAGLPRTTCHRFLQTLLHWKMVEKTPNSQYVLGVLILELSSLYIRSSDMREHYRPFLALARDLSGEAACLVVKRDLSRICIDYVPSKQSIAYNPKIGETLPISVGASGRAFLSDIESKEQREAAVKSLYEERDAKSQTTMFVRAEEEREQGYFVSALDRPGMNGLAVPLRNFEQRIIATVSIVGPSDRWTIERIHDVAPQIVSAVQVPYSGTDRNPL